MNYKIKIKGKIDESWSELYPGFSLFYDKNITVLSGYVSDQSALHGILDRIRNMNLTLLSVEKLDIDNTKIYGG